MTLRLFGMFCVSIWIDVRFIYCTRTESFIVNVPVLKDGMSFIEKMNESVSVSPFVCSLLRHSSIADVKHLYEWCQMPTFFLSTIILTTNKRCCGPEAKLSENWQTIVRIILAIQSKANEIHKFCVGQVFHCEANHNTRNVSANGFVLDRIASCLRFVPRGKMKNDKDTVMVADCT